MSSNIHHFEREVIVRNCSGITRWWLRDFLSLAPNCTRHMCLFPFRLLPLATKKTKTAGTQIKMAAANTSVTVSSEPRSDTPLTRPSRLLITTWK